MKARENPFASHRVEAIAFEPQGTTWDELMGRLEALGRRAAIVGPDGSGKTTLMEELERRLAAAGFEVRSARLDLRKPELSARERRGLLDGAGAKTVLLIDGADHLPRWRWAALKLRARRAGGGLIITSHRAGLLPTLLETRTSPELLRGIVARLLDGRVPEDVDALYARHGGNVREALRELYDRYGAVSR